MCTHIYPLLLYSIKICIHIHNQSSQLHSHSFIPTVLAIQPAGIYAYSKNFTRSLVVVMIVVVVVVVVIVNVVGVSKSM